LSRFFKFQRVKHWEPPAPHHSRFHQARWERQSPYPLRRIQGGPFPPTTLVESPAMTSKRKRGRVVTSRRRSENRPLHRIVKILVQGPLGGGFRQDLHKILSQGPVPDHVRTAKGFHRDLLKSLSPRLAQDHAKAADSISLGSPQDLRRRKCKRL
jgi:hypothetical protein